MLYSAVLTFYFDMGSCKVAQVSLEPILLPIWVLNLQSLFLSFSEVRITSLCHCV